MALHEPSPPFQPLFQAADRIVRRPLTEWKRAVYASMSGMLRSAEPSLAALEPALNLLSLFEAYQGNHQRAFRICDAQIRFWRAIGGQSGQRHHLAQVIQPWLNLARLDRWQGRLDTAGCLYQEFSPAQRGLPGQLASRYGIAHSLVELGELDAQSGFDFTAYFNAVYWSEYAGVLFRADRNDELQAHLSAGLAGNFSRTALLEYLLASLARRGHYPQALEILRRIMPAKEQPCWLHWQTTALQMHAAHDRRAALAAGPHAEVFAAAMAGSHGRRDVHELSLLLEVARVFGTLGLADQARQLGERAYAMAAEVDDEVLLFEAAKPLAHSRDIDMHAMFRDSGYALIRKRMGLPEIDAAATPDVAAAVEALAALDYAGCADILDAASAASGW